MQKESNELDRISNKIEGSIWGSSTTFIKENFHFEIAPQWDLSFHLFKVSQCSDTYKKEVRTDILLGFF